MALAAQPRAARSPVEINIGPIVAPARILGMGGAYTSIAEGIGASMFNPAASANRFLHNSDVFFDWDWDLDWLIVGAAGRNIDLDNSRLARPSDQLAIWSGALGINLGRFGLGAAVESQNITIGGAAISASLVGLSGGYSAFDAALVVGGQIRFASMSVTPSGPMNSALPSSDIRGAGLAAGAVYRPIGEPYRLGLTAIGPIRLGPYGVAPAGLLDRGVVPWQIAVGASYTLGSLLNPPVTFGVEGQSGPSLMPADPEDRGYITIALDLVLTGSDPGAIGFGSWALGVEQRAGASATLGAGVGIDSEFVPDRLRGRMGFYLEPSRFSGIEGRTHITGGLDLRLFQLIWDWRFTFGFDLAERYGNGVLSVGLWH
jgi:hypothetical protein